MLFLLFSIVLLALCFSENNQALDGEYYGINKYRNERAFTISGNIRTINSCLFSCYALKVLSSQMLHRPKKIRNIVLLYLTALLRR